MLRQRARLKKTWMRSFESDGWTFRWPTSAYAFGATRQTGQPMGEKLSLLDITSSSSEDIAGLTWTLKTPLQSEESLEWWCHILLKGYWSSV